jgi:hypothetical protein
VFIRTLSIKDGTITSPRIDRMLIWAWSGEPNTTLCVGAHWHTIQLE